MIEVAETSLAKDLGRMRAAYAAGGVPASWVLDLRTRAVDARAEPVGGDAPGYRSARTFGEADAIPLALDGRPIAEPPVASLLPAATG